MANYFDEISNLMKLVVHKLEIINKKGFSFGKGFDRYSIVDIVLLGSIYKGKSISIQKVIEESGVERSVAVTCINKLIKSNLVDRKKDNLDKRKFNLSVTEKGKELICTMREKEDDFLKFVLDGITINEAKAVLKFLSKINQTTVDKFDVKQMDSN